MSGDLPFGDGQWATQPFDSLVSCLLLNGFLDCQEMWGGFLYLRLSLPSKRSQHANCFPSWSDQTALWSRRKHLPLLSLCSSLQAFESTATPSLGPLPGSQLWEAAFDLAHICTSQWLLSTGRNVPVWFWCPPWSQSTPGEFCVIGNVVRGRLQAKPWKLSNSFFFF